MADKETAIMPGGEETKGQPKEAMQADRPETARSVVYAYNDPATLAKAGRIIRAAMARRRERERNNIPAPREGD